jgi:DNA-binding MarR family transcriptional regulator
MSNDYQKAWGTGEWIAAQETPRGRLEAELIEAVRASQNATHQMDEAAHAAMGINATDGRCLDIIDRRGRIAAGRLAEEAGVTTGAITAVLDRLEGKGYVRRVADPEDRRRTFVEITEKQREAAMRLYWPLKELSDGWVEERSEEELRLLVEFMRLSARINEVRAAEIRAELEGSGG